MTYILPHLDVREAREYCIEQYGAWSRVPLPIYWRQSGLLDAWLRAVESALDDRTRV